VRPATVNRELDTLRSILSRAVEWGVIVESPARNVKRLKLDNRRTRILDGAEQAALLAGCTGRKLRALVQVALVTGARLGELLALSWDQCRDGFVTFLETKNGRMRRIPISPTLAAVLERLPRVSEWVFSSPRTGEAYTATGIRHMFNRAVVRAGLVRGEVTCHTLRHTALSRMIAAGLDDYTAMAISGHSSTRMLARYTHPTEERKLDALEAAATVVTKWSQTVSAESVREKEASEIASFLKEFGGRRGDRTPDLCIANAALSQLS
jgi:integrase